VSYVYALVHSCSVQELTLLVQAGKHVAGGWSGGTLREAESSSRSAVLCCSVLCRPAASRFCCSTLLHACPRPSSWKVSLRRLVSCSIAAWQHDALRSCTRNHGIREEGFVESNEQCIAHILTSLTFIMFIVLRRNPVVLSWLLGARACGLSDTFRQTTKSHGYECSVHSFC
jgi:hypothetical protein